MALESDFQREYGIVLTDALWGVQAVGVRRLQSLISGLPPTSALAREMHPTTLGADWGVTEELLATALELLDQGNRQFVVANSKKGSRVPSPIKIKRPWEPKGSAATKRSATLAEISQLMGKVGNPTVVPARGG